MRYPFIAFEEVREAGFAGPVVAVVVELEDFFVGTGEGTACMERFSFGVLGMGGEQVHTRRGETA